MQSRSLPARPHLDHLKNEAKALHKLIRDGDADALRRLHEAIGDAASPIKLSDAQRIIAREYGFPTWARLRDHVAFARNDDAVSAFLAAIQGQELDTARRMLTASPSLPTESLHVAAALGDAANVRRLIGKDPSQVLAKLGNPAADPLLFLCFSPLHGESAERDRGMQESARLLLDAGADPNTVDGRYGVSALYGVTGQRSVIPVAKMLLDAGANPTDGESLHHSAENFHVEALELLLAAGADLDATGTWGNTPLYFLTRWYNFDRYENARRGFEWLLDHGADPDVRCGPQQETALHAAAWRGQDPAYGIQLLGHGAAVSATRADGRTAWQLAKRNGYEEFATMLESHGARRDALSDADLLLAACGRGDEREARRITSPALLRSLTADELAMLPDSASAGRAATVGACLAAGFPVDTVDAEGATAVHHAAIHGRVDLTRRLIEAGARLDIVDPRHHSPPIGWATFGADFVRAKDGDYEGVLRALLGAGARFTGNEHPPADAGLRAILGLS